MNLFKYHCMTSQKNFKNFKNKYYTHDSIDSLSSSVGNLKRETYKKNVRKMRKKKWEGSWERERELYDRNVREMHEKCVFTVKQRE